MLWWLHSPPDETIRTVETPLNPNAVGSNPGGAGFLFRWVQCQLVELGDCYTEGQVQRVLEELPEGLYETYDRILERIDKKKFGGQIAKSILLWLVGALKPLNLKLLTEGVTFDIQRSEKSNGEGFLSNEDFLNVCGSLVRYDRKDDVVSLSHFSVKEYLFHAHLRNGALSRYHISPPIADSHLVMLCIDYFRTPQMVPEFQSCFGPFNWIDSLLPNWGLPQYVANLGGRHFGRVVKTEEPLHELMQSMLVLRNALRAQSTEPDMVLNFIVSWGTPSFLKTYLDHLETIRLTDTTDGNSPLGYAIAHDNFACAETLLNLGLDINLLCRKLNHTKLPNKEFIHPLEAAVIDNRLAIVDLLLSRHCFIPQDIIYSAIMSCYTSTSSIIFSLLKYEANVTVPTTCGDSPLHLWLRDRSCDSTVRLNVTKALVNAGCHPRSKNAAGTTPLSLALDHNDGALVDYFIGQGALFEDFRYIHLVDFAWADRLSWYNAAVGAVRAAKHVLEVVHSITLADVCRVRLMLQKRFKITPLILGNVLDLAEY
ncbi:ankyrin repeat-containing domain protein [Melanogaster broomeanus]|nr:ankyrin repeat-containing domain protein [Melanogaster broomeanus]